MTEHVCGEFLTIKQFANKHPAFGENTIRWYIFQSVNRKSSKGHIQSNGFSTAYVRIGRRIYINEESFFEWIMASNH